MDAGGHTGILTVKPGLLRLDSVGEDLPVNIPVDNKIYSLGKKETSRMLSDSLSRIKSLAFRSTKSQDGYQQNTASYFCRERSFSVPERSTIGLCGMRKPIFLNSFPQKTDGAQLFPTQPSETLSKYSSDADSHFFTNKKMFKNIEMNLDGKSFPTRSDVTSSLPHSSPTYCMSSTQPACSSVSVTSLQPSLFGCNNAYSLLKSKMLLNMPDKTSDQDNLVLGSSADEMDCPGLDITFRENIKASSEGSLLHNNCQLNKRASSSPSTKEYYTMAASDMLENEPCVLKPDTGHSLIISASSEISKNSRPSKKMKKQQKVNVQRTRSLATEELVNPIHQCENISNKHKRKCQPLMKDFLCPFIQHDNESDKEIPIPHPLLMEKSSNSFLQHENENIPDSENSKNLDMPTVDKNDPFLFKSFSNLVSVLSAPREIFKKGRPSSKKQKKRQREKYRHKSQPCVTEESSNAVQLEATKKQACSKIKPAFRESAEERSLSKSSSEFSQAAKLSLKSSDVEGGIDKHGNKVTNKPATESVKILCISPVKDDCFNFALDLDSIFKRKSNLDLKFVLDATKNGTNCSPLTFAKNCSLYQSGSFSLSDYDSFEDADPFTPSTSFEPALCGFSSGLALDSLLKSPLSAVQPVTPQSSSVFDLCDSPSVDSATCISNDYKPDLEPLISANAKWDEHYPTAGFRSCFTSENEISDPSIKVHFATEPSLLTVYFVGTEERGGTWHHYALDRERFERRILDAGKVISPVLEAGHRAKIIEYLQQPCLVDSSS